MHSFRSEFRKIIQEGPKTTWLTLLSAERDAGFTRHDLALRTADYCAFYRAREVRPGDTILIVLKESLDLFASFFAGILCGALPAYYAYPSPKQSNESFLSSVGDLLQHNRIRLVIGFAEVVEVLRRSVSFGGSGFAGSFDIQEVPSAESEDLRLDEAASLPEAFLQFSSGTTGAKKGVSISVGALLNQLAAYQPCVAYDQDSRVVSWLPHYHDMGLIACMLMPFLSRVPIFMMSPFEWVRRPAMLLEAIAKYRGTHVWLPNFALGHLTGQVSPEEMAQCDLSSLRRLVCCSEPVLYETVAAFIDRFAPAGLDPRVLRNCYAMAENTFAMTSSIGEGLRFLEVDAGLLQTGRRISAQPGGRSIASAGKPLANLEIKIVDASGVDLGADQVGEIVIASDCMLEGYHNNPAETERAFLGGYFKTGDLGFLHEGELFVTGRKKDLIIVGGENIYPQDIELILNQEPGLIPGRNLAFGVDDKRVGTERVVILAEASGLQEGVDTAALRTKILNRLNVAVSEIVLLEHMTLLKSTAGKVSRQLNKTAYLEGRYGSSAASKTAPGLQEMVLSIIPGFIKPALTAETPLFTSGIIDSFGFAALLTTLEREYGLKVPEAARQTANFETLAQIERLIAGGEVKQHCMALALEENSCIFRAREESLRRLMGGSNASPQRPTWREFLINGLPWRGSLIYRGLFRLIGIQIGTGVVFLGAVALKLRGKARNIIIEDKVTLGDRVDLRNRENGRIVLRQRAYLDHGVRLVAARDGLIEIGAGSEIGAGTIINSGGITRVGRFVMIGSGAKINSSSHGTAKEAFVKEQPHVHGTVEIEDDVWIGAGASILPNTRIGTGAVIASNSLVSGEIEPFAVFAGVPGKLVRYRS